MHKDVYVIQYYNVVNFITIENKLENLKSFTIYFTLKVNRKKYITKLLFLNINHSFKSVSIAILIYTGKT